MKAKKTFKMIGTIIITLIIIGVILLIVINSTTDKLVCKSKEGNITILYTDNNLVGYTSRNISYNLDEQKEAAKKMGTTQYITEFQSWFVNNTTGSCKIK